MRRYQICLVLSVAAVLLACGGNIRAPVEERRSNTQTAPKTYTVKRGDTLYSIAWRYGLDYRVLASNNGINSAYRIYPGQTLRVRVLAQNSSVTAAPVTTPSTKPAPRKPRSHAAPRPSTPVAAANSPYGPVTSWRWPTEGKVGRKFSSTVHKGIDIEGRAGDVVRSVAAGKVVYAGSGIVGYGELIIVKHNEQYLSAYGHNRLLVVAEGAQVLAGQKIAEKGNSGTNTVKLHFEIRRGGKPVDPLKMLPRR